MMKKLDRYVTLNFIKSIIIGTLAFTLFYVLSDFFRVISPILKGNFSAQDGFLSILYLVPSHMITIAPIGVLIGCLMFTNTMASNLEIIALKSSGISLRRIMRYPILVALLFSFFLLYLSVDWSPKLTFKSNILQHRSNGEIKESPIVNNLYLQNGNYYYYIKEANIAEKRLKTLEIVEVSPDFNQAKTIYTADSAKLINGVWQLKNGTINHISEKKQSKYDTLDVKFMHITFKQRVQRDVIPASKTPGELYDIISKYNFSAKQKTMLLATLYQLFSYPFMCFFTCFLGFALGSRYVRGGAAMSIALAVIIGYSFFIIDSIFITIAGSPNLPTLFLVLLPKAIFLGIGLYFMNKAEH